MTSRFTRRAIAAALLFVPLAAAGCGKPESTTPAAAAPATAAPRGLKIAVIAKSSTNPVFLSARTGAEAAAKELSQKHNIPIEIVWLTPPSEDGQVQAQRIAQAVNEGANAVLISCSDAGKVTGAINDAVSRGVPVMTFDSDAPQSKRFAFYGVDDVKTGEAVMDELAAQMGEKGRSRSSPATRTRRTCASASTGSSRRRRSYPGIKIVDTFYHIETPQDAAAEVIRVQNAYPQIQGWAMIGGWPLFTQTLLTDLDPAKVEDRRRRRAAGRARLRREGAGAGAARAADLHVGLRRRVQRIFDKVQLKQDVPQIIPMELVRVTKENLGHVGAAAQDWGFTDVPEAYLKLK